MPRSRSRSKSQGRVDPVRRACQLRRFHRDLKAKHPYKKDLNRQSPAGSEREQAPATDTVGTANLDGPAGSSADPNPPLWNLQAGEKARNAFEEGLKVHTAGPLDTRPSSAGPLVSRPLDTAAGKSNRTEPRAIRYQNAQMYPSLPVHSRPSNEQPRSSFRLPTNARESFGSQEVVDAIARYTSSSTTSHSTAVHKETEAEALERREKDLARKREENALATAAYDEIPQPYLDWLMAYKDASRRQRAMEEAEEQCEAVHARVKVERDALDVATRELEGAKRAVTNAKQRFELAMGRGSGHEGAVLSRDVGAADDDAPLHALRSHRKQRAEAYNTALERCTTAAKEHAAAYDDWTTARDAYQEAEVLEVQRKRAWEQLRGVRRGDVGR
ncbi:hypothetical protein COL26b_014113 [Colletotrichum chrysophilum]|uniref:uncharacterized protein n=1 Tax=Colletotrichum chrysophilum TaxID=1836956 RepID=UPI002301DE01|nr:uncharacterized protein COL26b_014113 [Colletotrichum chrysophilum]KAJ0360308.1 hypothetical protein COL26b_014113 [Colletotrichum chrysophilum]